MTRPDSPMRDAGRGRRANGGAPVAEPGLSSGGADAEAGGARDAIRTAAMPPTASSKVEAGGLGVRLTPRIWFIVAALLAALGVATLIASF